jgi:hypothetical protein
MTNEITPEVREGKKTEAQRAVNIAYTINHALACTATDFIDPYFGNLTQRYLGKRFSIGCGHDHSKDKHGHCKHHGLPCAHPHHHRDYRHQHSHLKHWWIGEAVGDFGAVPVTIATQSYFPGFMNGLRKVMEPMLGGFFRKGAKRASKKWAQTQGIAKDSQEFKEHVEAVYQHEVSHLPQALMWTVSSIAINLCTQRAIGNKGPFWQLAAGKAVGASISAGLVVGGRGLAPDTAGKWDSFTSEKLFLPTTKTIGRIFGVKNEDVDRMSGKEKQLRGESWVERTKSFDQNMGRNQPF